MANDFSGPIIFNYVWWVLQEAQKRGIHRLYFLARDGYTLLRIARLFCEKFSLDIDCRYLYCSRMSLRMPCYSLSKDEAKEQIFSKGYCVTLKTILQRGGLEEKERTDVYRECGLSDIDEEKPLTREEMDQYSIIINKSPIFWHYVCKNSTFSLESTIGYLRQEGLIENGWALVDSGWTGSMQHAIRLLLRSAGYSGKLTGFYFGMYVTPKAQDDGEYLTWFFSSKKGKLNKLVFNNNLFEILLSAPHGMTYGYRKEKEYVPILMTSPQGKEKDAIEMQSTLILEFCKNRLDDIDFHAFDDKKRRNQTVKIAERYMLRPTTEEAAYYGIFLFCDDVTDSMRSSVAGADQMKQMKEYLLPRRIWNRVTGRGSRELFWPYGTVSFLKRFRWWYRLNLFFWDWLRYTLHRNK